MSTRKQIEANRLNAQKSTGPRTDAGKAASRFNALKSGIDAQAEVILGEDPAHLEALASEYQARFDTSTPERRFLVDTLVHCDWTLRRLHRAESQYGKYQNERDCQRDCPPTAYPEGQLLHSCDKAYGRLQRRINATQRNYQLALKHLETLDPAAFDSEPRNHSPAPPPEPPPPATPVPPDPPSDEFPAIPTGFVPRYPSNIVRIGPKGVPSSPSPPGVR